MNDIYLLSAILVKRSTVFHLIPCYHAASNMYPMYAHFPFCRCLKKELLKSIQIPSKMIEFPTFSPLSLFNVCPCQTLSVTIRNFWASAELWESAQLRPGGECWMATGERYSRISIRFLSDWLKMACFQQFSIRNRNFKKILWHNSRHWRKGLVPTKTQVSIKSIWKESCNSL